MLNLVVFKNNLPSESKSNSFQFADPRFPVPVPIGGANLQRGLFSAEIYAKTRGRSRISRGGVDPFVGRGPPTWALFGESVCENKRIGPAAPPGSANAKFSH